MSLSLGPGPCPSRIAVTLQYSSYDASTGSDRDKLFQLNSIYKPDYTGSGHQPRGRDQYAILYNRYRVIRVCASVIASNGGNPAVVGLCGDSSTSAYTSLQDFLEQPGAYLRGVGTNGVGMQFITQSYNMWDLLGVSKQTYFGDDTYAADVGSSPSQTAILHLYNSLIGGGLTTGSFVEMLTRLDIDVEFFDPKQLGGS